MHGSSLSPQKYRTATAIEALRYAKRTAKEQVIGDLREKYGDAGDLDSALVDSWRLSMRTRIQLAWRQRRKLTTDVVQPLSCFREGDLIEKRGQLEVGPATCLVDPECCLASELRRNPDHLEKLLATVQGQESKAENERRAKVLKDLRWKPRQRMTDKMCRNLGDAMFAFFAPRDSVILTTNARDHGPLAAAVGKSVRAVETPREIRPDSLSNEPGEP